jgi:hypothetical protein
VHWFNATQSGLPLLPATGWNVETVFGVSNNDDSYNSAGVQAVLGHATNAYSYGMTNITRLDWKRNKAVAKVGESGFGSWKSNLWQAVNALKSVCTIFIVGNEPTLASEGCIHSGEYAASYNSMYSDDDKVTSVLYLVAGPAAWSFMNNPDESDIEWLASVSSSINGTDGFAIHTYESIEEGCTDPRNTCTPLVSDGDRGFRRYRNYTQAVEASWPSKPVYITEFNTHGFGASGEHDRVPQNNYPTGFMQNAYEDIRNYNMGSSTVKVLAACWFVDATNRDPLFSWSEYALSNNAPRSHLVQARSDFISTNTATGISS